MRNTQRGRESSSPSSGHEAMHVVSGEKDSRPLSRRGFSLVETLVVASISGVIFLTVAVLLAGVLRVSGRSTAAIERQQTWHRLTLAWREDVHAASDVVVEETDDVRSSGNVVMTIRPADETDATIEYIALPGEIVRRTQGKDQAEASSQESFRLPPDEVATFSVDVENNTAMIRWEPRSTDEQPPAASRTLEIIAVIGLDRP